MTLPFDAAFVIAAQQILFTTSWMTAVAIFCARWLIVLYVCFGCVMLVVQSPRLRHGAREAFWSFCIAVILTSSLSAVLLRPRPFVAYPDVRLLIPIPFNASFPSGHTAAAIAIACALFVADPVLGIVAFVMAVFIAFGRILVGVHYPSDILGGIVIGLLSYGIVRAGHHALRQKEIIRAAKRHHHDA